MCVFVSGLGAEQGCRVLLPWGQHPNPTALVAPAEHHPGPGVGDVEGARAGLWWAACLR